MVHPDFNKATFEYDYALVELDGISTIAPANIDLNNVSNSYENHVNKYIIKYIDKKCGLLVIS